VSTLSHSGRTALIKRAKAVAVPVTSCVAASLRPDHLVAGWSWEQMSALVIVLAESADLTRLHAVVAAKEDASPPAGLAEVRLRRAHTEFQRLRAAGVAREDIPALLSRLERDYQRASKDARRQRLEVA
jgi:hypothetical protein